MNPRSLCLLTAIVTYSIVPLIEHRCRYILLYDNGSIITHDISGALNRNTKTSQVVA